MPKVGIVHTTEYRYLRPVRFTTHRLMLRPRDSHDLRLIRAILGVSPPVATTRWAHDVFANSVAFADWGADRVAQRLVIASTLELEHFPGGPSQTQERLDPLAEMYPFSYAAEEFPDLARSLERHYPDPHRRIDRWARRFVGSGGTATMAMLTAITEAIRAEFAYVARDAEGTMAPLQTLDAKSGACRDLAVFMMEAVRSLGIAARFVSGYLYDEALVDAAEHLVGGGATHAWCEVYLPGAGWVEFDPTNGLVAGRNLIRVCVARTPEQAIPVAGGFIGALKDYEGMDVNVTVSVSSAQPVPRETVGA